jgi:Ca2+/H+ antiporter
MIPGVYLFRMGSGPVQIAGGTQSTTDLMNTIASGATAAMIILAMSFGLIIPKLTIDYFSDRTTEATS